jgi:hypothetical protein
MKRRDNNYALTLDPDYKEAIEAQKVQAEDVRSIVDCVRYVLINGNDDEDEDGDRDGEVEVTGSLNVARNMLDRIVNGLDYVNLRVAASKERQGAKKRLIRTVVRKSK